MNRMRECSFAGPVKGKREAEVTGSSMARWLLRRTESFFYRGLRGPDALSLTSKTVWHPTNGLQPSTGCVFPSPRRSHARTLRQSRPPAWRRTSQDTSRAKGEICELRSPRPYIFRFPSLADPAALHHGIGVCTRLF